MAPSNKIHDLFNVDGLVAVITGGGSGLGLYAARALDANGAKAVYIVGRREETLKEAAATGINGTIKPIVGDVTSKESLQQVVEQIEKEQGYVNFLFANSGILGHSDTIRKNFTDTKTGPTATVQEFTEHVLGPSLEDFNKVLATNVTGVFATALAFLPLLEAGNKKRNVAQDSQILITSSVAGSSRNLTCLSYAVSKAAVNHLAKILSSHFGVQNFYIRVNVVAPGLYQSELTTRVTDNLDGFKGVDGAWEDARALSPNYTPAGRTGSEEDFAATVLFFASRAGAYLNGEALLTDGGRIGQIPATL